MYIGEFFVKDLNVQDIGGIFPKAGETGMCDRQKTRVVECRNALDQHMVDALL